MQPPAKALPRTSACLEREGWKNEAVSKGGANTQLGVWSLTVYHLPFVMSQRASSLDCVYVFLHPRYLEYSESKYSGREFLHFWRGDGETVGLKNLVKLIWTNMGPSKLASGAFFYVFSFSIPTSTESEEFLNPEFQLSRSSINQHFPSACWV